jgi:hypothetical protein
MNYIDVAWKSSAVSDPVRLVSELDPHRFETRKLEFFRNGEVGSASGSHRTAHTRLGSETVPSLPEINADPQFCGLELSAPEFLRLWSQYGRPLQAYESVELLAPASGLPIELVGTRAVVLLVYQSATSPAYELECVAANGSTLWQGALPRELLRAITAEDA